MSEEENMQKPYKDDTFPAHALHAAPEEPLTHSGEDLLSAVSSTKTARVKNPRKTLRLSLIVFAAIGVAFLAALLTANWHFSNHVAPGVYFGTHNLTAKSKNEVRQIVEKDMEALQLTLTDNHGKSMQVALSDLGFDINLDKTVNMLMQVKQSSWYERLNPWKRVHRGFENSQNSSQFRTFLSSHFLTDSDKETPASLRFDEQNNRFTVIPGKPGKGLTYNTINQAIRKLLRANELQATATFSYKTTESPITDQIAQQAADKANTYLNSPVTVTTSINRSYTVQPKQIMSWLRINQQADRRNISVGIDGSAINTFVSQQLPQYLNSEEAVKQDLLSTSAHGVNTIEFTDSAQLAKKIASALQKGKPSTIEAPVNITMFNRQKTIPHMLVVINKSTQTASVYQDGKLIKTFLVCTGKAGHDTNNGVFSIYLRHSVQDLRGSNGDGTTYFAPGVKWVSYFDGGIGFHTAIWNYDGIKHGNPKTQGSHGCINMYEQDAQWIFEHCPKGTTIQVVGSMPDGPVR